MSQIKFSQQSIKGLPEALAALLAQINAQGTAGSTALTAAIDAEIAARTAADNAISNVLDVVNGDSTVEGSFRKVIADVVGSAPEALDTLKEIADFLGSDGVSISLGDVQYYGEGEAVFKLDVMAGETYSVSLDWLNGATSRTFDPTVTDDSYTVHPDIFSETGTIKTLATNSLDRWTPDSPFIALETGTIYISVHYITDANGNNVVGEGVNIAAKIAVTKNVVSALFNAIKTSESLILNKLNNSTHSYVDKDTLNGIFVEGVNQNMVGADGLITHYIAVQSDIDMQNVLNFGSVRHKTNDGVTLELPVVSATSGSGLNNVADAHRYGYLIVDATGYLDEIGAFNLNSNVSIKLEYLATATGILTV